MIVDAIRGQIVQHDSHTRADQSLRDGETHVAASSRDDGDPLVETHCARQR
jgi:hypothetical protein